MIDYNYYIKNNMLRTILSATKPTKPTKNKKNEEKC